MKESESESHSAMSDSSLPHGLYSPWNLTGQNTGVGSHSLLQGIFPTQGSNPGPLHCRWIIYKLSHRGSPRILEWVAYPFSMESSQHRDQTGVPYIAGRFFTNQLSYQRMRNNQLSYLSSYHLSAFSSSFFFSVKEEKRIQMEIKFVYTLEKYEQNK